MIFQVFDLGEQAPDKVLRTVYANLESLSVRGDEFAKEIRERLKLIVSCDYKNIPSCDVYVIIIFLCKEIYMAMVFC